MKQPDVFLKHILDEINYILTNTSNIKFEKFIQDETLKRSGGGVDYKTVWDIVKNKIPKIKGQIEALLKISR